MTACDGMGMTFPGVGVAWKRKLDNYDIAPFLDRPRFKKTARYYDRKEGKVVETEVETHHEGVEADTTERFLPPTRPRPSARSRATRRRASATPGEGFAAQEGEVAGRPEAERLVGLRNTARPKAALRLGQRGPYAGAERAIHRDAAFAKHANDAVLHSSLSLSDIEYRRVLNLRPTVSAFIREGVRLYL